MLCFGLNGFSHLLHNGDLRVHWMTASSSGPFLYSAAAASEAKVGEAHLFQSPLGLAPLRLQGAAEKLHDKIICEVCVDKR